MSDEPDEIVTEQSLRKLYYDPVSGYQSMEKLYQESKREGLDVSRQNVKDWLQAQLRDLH